MYRVPSPDSLTPSPNNSLESQAGQPLTSGPEAPETQEITNELRKDTHTQCLKPPTFPVTWNWRSLLMRGDASPRNCDDIALPITMTWIEPSSIFILRPIVDFPTLRSAILAQKMKQCLFFLTFDNMSFVRMSLSTAPAATTTMVSISVCKWKEVATCDSIPFIIQSSSDILHTQTFLIALHLHDVTM